MTRRRCLTALLAAGAIATPLGAQDSLPADLGARVDRIFARFDRSTPGCGVGLAKDGRPVYVHAYGAANLEYGVPNTDSTVFESGSVAKQFTAASLVLLDSEGRLSLDDDVRKYLPEVPSFGGQRITIRHLLTHTSGLRDQWGLLGLEGRGPGTQVHSPMTTLDLVSRQQKLNFPPGSAYLYSNTGYALAGLVVQRVSGKSLDAFMQERFFHPLGMTHTRWRDDFTTVVRNRATAYSGDARTGFHTDMPFTNMVGNGGLLSTMGDLLKWNEELDNPTIGGPAFTRTMEAQMRLTNGRTISYALGLDVSRYAGVREVSHSGATAGYRTFMARYPGQRVSVAVWCNSADAGPTLLAHQVADVVLRKAPAAVAPMPAARVALAPGEITRWAGTYRDPVTDQAVVIVAGESGLTARAGNGPGIWFAPVGEARFRGDVGDVEFSARDSRRAFTVVRADGDSSRFEEVGAAPSTMRLADYAGIYASDELDATYTLVEKGGKLLLRRRPDFETELRPVYADDFAASGGLGTVRFTRDGQGQVTGLSFYADRVLDVRFRRVR